MAELEDRLRSLEDRVRNIEVAQVGIQSEQTHLRELMNARFSTIEAGMAALGTKVDAIPALVNSLGADAANSPAGRALVRDITESREDRSALHLQLAAHETFIDGARTIIALVKWVGFPSLVLLAAIAITNVARLNGLLR